MLHANAAAVVTDVIVTTYRLFSAVQRKRSTRTRSVQDSPSSEWRSSSSPAVESTSRLDCFQNSRITKTSSAPTPSTMNTPKKLSIPIHVTPIACTYTNCATTSDAMTAVIPPRARNVEPVCALTRKSTAEKDPAAHLKSPQRYSSPMSLSAHMCRHDAVISPLPHDSTIGPATSFAHRVAAAYPGVPLGASRNASRVTSVLALASSSPSAPASPKRRSARRFHGAASAAISNAPPLRSFHRAATAPNLIALAAAAGSKDPSSHPSSSDGVDGRKSARAIVFTSSSVGAADRTQSHISTRPFPTTHARAATSSLALHPRGSHPRLGRSPHRTPPAVSRETHTRRTDSIPSFNCKTARAVRANASGTPRRPTCSYAETTSKAENAGAHPSQSFSLEAAEAVWVSFWVWFFVAVLSLIRSHAPPYPGDRSIALLSSHTRRSARGPNASPSARDVLTMTVNSSAPPAPPQAPAFGSVASALSGALLLGKSASTLDAVSLAAAPGVTASSRSTRRASASIDAPKSTSSGDTGPRGGSVVTVDVETSLSNCRERSPVLVPRTR